MVIIPTAKGIFDTVRTEAMESSWRGSLVARQGDSQQQALGSCKRGSFIHAEDEGSEKGSDFTPVFHSELILLTHFTYCSKSPC